VGVTDNRPGRRDSDEARATDNRASRDKNGVTDSRPIARDASDTRNTLTAEREARRRGRACEECGGEIGDDDTVYRLRFTQMSSFGGTQNTLKTLCDACAREVVSGWLYRLYRRSLVYYHCRVCERKVVMYKGKRRYHFCSEDCRRRYRNLTRRTATHQSTCEVCGSPFTSKRSDAKTCSDACRQKAYRQSGRWRAKPGGRTDTNSAVVVEYRE
jgi:hypothetical protein